MAVIMQMSICGSFQIIIYRILFIKKVINLYMIGLSFSYAHVLSTTPNMTVQTID